MAPHRVFALALIAAAIAGMVSPATLVVAIFAWIWMPPGLLTSPGIVLFASMLVSATGTLLLAGVPAAIYERATGRSGTSASLWIWAASSVTLAALGVLWRFAVAGPPAA